MRGVRDGTRKLKTTMKNDVRQGQQNILGCRGPTGGGKEGRDTPFADMRRTVALLCGLIKLSGPGYSTTAREGNFFVALENSHD